MSERCSNHPDAPLMHRWCSVCGTEVKPEPHDAGPTRDAELLDMLEHEICREPFHRPSALDLLAKLRYRAGYRAARAKARKLRQTKR